MFLALKWERAGAMLGGASLALLVIGLLGSGFHGSGDPTLAALWGSILLLVFFLPVVLYILCWWLEDRDRKRYRAGS
jgi:phage shock protein PspC (stress-responsive transcriptional regulator)